MNTIKQHICWLDAVRVLACLLVCVIHAPIPSGQSSVWLSVYNYLSAPCIGLFFMVSGALLFPVRLSTRDFIRKRFVRILPPLLIWSIISVVVHYCLGQTDAETAISKICKLPFFPVEGVYWFMYAILGLYLFAPLLSPALEKMDNARYFVMIWTLTLIMPYINAWLPEAWSMQGQYSHILGEFPGYMGYMVLGYWLCRSNTSWSRYIFLILIPGSILAVVIPAYFIKGQYPAITHELLYGYLTVNVAALCLIYFTLVKKMAAISCMRSLNRGGG